MGSTTVLRFLIRSAAIRARRGAALLLPLCVLAWGSDVRRGSAADTDLGARLDRLLHRQPARIPDLMANGKPTLLFFSDRACVWCLRSIPAMEALVQEFAYEANLFTVDPERGDPGTVHLVTKYGVWGVPTFVFLDHEGKPAGTLFSQQRLERLKSQLERLIAAAPKKEVAR